MKNVSVIIPARNEEKTIGRVLDSLLETEKKIINYIFENIVVDDNSFDNTGRVAKERECLLLKNRAKPGKGNALKAGFDVAGGDYIFMMDADYSHRPEDMHYFLQQLENGAGLVIGSRILGGSEEYTRLRAFGNIFLTWVFGFLMGRYLSDALNGYKAFDRKLITEFKYFSNDFEIEIELISNALRLGFPVVEVASHERGRIGGVAKSKICKNGLKFFFRIIIEKFKIKLKKNE